MDGLFWNLFALCNFTIVSMFVEKKKFLKYSLRDSNMCIVTREVCFFNWNVGVLKINCLFSVQDKTGKVFRLFIHRGVWH